MSYPAENLDELRDPNYCTLACGLGQVVKSGAVASVGLVAVHLPLPDPGPMAPLGPFPHTGCDPGLFPARTHHAIL